MLCGDDAPARSIVHFSPRPTKLEPSPGEIAREEGCLPAKLESMQVPERLRQVAKQIARTGRPYKAKVRTLLGWFGHRRRGENVVLAIRKALQ